MHGVSIFRNIAAYLAGRFAGFVSATAGGAGDATEVDGPWIDRQGFESLMVALGFEAVLANTETLSFAFNLQDADDDQGTNAADFGTAVASAVAVTGDASPSGTFRGVVEHGFNVLGARRYIRLQWTPDLSAGGTDTADIMALLILGRPQSIT